jgi:hypothetical protein
MINERIFVRCGIAASSILLRSRSKSARNSGHSTTFKDLTNKITEMKAETQRYLVVRNNKIEEVPMKDILVECVSSFILG